MRDGQGRKIREGKAEVEKFAEHVGLDVDNPCSVLSQDQSREFLHSGNPSDRYKFFVHATKLLQIQECLLEARNKKQAVVDFVREKKKLLPELERERKELTDKLEASKKLDELRQEVTKVRHKKAWATVYEHDAQIEKRKSAVDKIDNEALPTLEANKEAAESEYARAQKAVDEVAGSFEGISDRVNLISREHKLLTDQGKQHQRERARLKSDIRQWKSERKNCSEQCATLEQACVRAQTAAKDDVSNQHQEHFQAMEREQEKLDAFSREVASLEASEEEAMKTMGLKADEKDRLEDEERLASRKCDTTRTQLTNLQSQGSNEAAIFGKSMVALLREVEKVKAHFHTLPIGPLGMHTKLTDRKWAMAVDESLSTNIVNFLCGDSHDLKLLQQCGKQANARVSAILVTNMNARAYTMPVEKLPPPELTTVHSVITTTSPVVTNALIDSCQTERQILAEDTQTGRRIAFAMNARNVKEVFAPDGTKLFRRGNTQNEIARQSTKPPRLGLDNARRIELYQREVGELEAEVADAKKRRRDAEEVYRASEREMRTTKQKRLKLSTDIKKTQDAIARLKSNAPDETRSVEDEIAEFRAEISKFEELMSEHDRNITAAEEKILRLDTTLAKLSDEIALKEEARRSLGEDNDKKLQMAEDSNRALVRAQKQVDKYTVALDKFRANKRQIEEHLEELYEMREKDAEVAKKICAEDVIAGYGGIGEDEHVDRLDARLKRLTNRIQAQEEQQGFSLPEVLGELDDVNRREEKTKRVVRDLSGVSAQMAQMISNRFKKLKESSDLLNTNCGHQFNSIMSRRGATGRLNIDFSNGTLDIQARMTLKGSKAKDTKAFSGGERSFVTMAFILALANQADPPLLALDEYDIFMDDFSRKLSTTTLLEYAKEAKHSKQFILITPHDIEHIIADAKVRKPELEIDRHVKILRMRPPRE